MSILAIDGITLDVSELEDGDKVKIGEQSRAFAGNLRSTERDEKTTFTFTTMPTSSATWVSLSSSITLGTQVTCSGDGLPGGSITASVKAKARAIAGTSPILWIITGSGEEV